MSSAEEAQPEARPGSAVPRRLNVVEIRTLWERSVDSDALPGMSIKGKPDGGSASRASDSLVVKRHDIAGRDVPETADAQPPPTADRRPDFELLSVIGEGGMGVVYAARQTSIDRTVAVKLIKHKAGREAERRARFLSEAAVTGELEHPNIVPIYDLGAGADGTLLYAMKRIQGTPWSKMIAERSLNENLDILLRVCDAIAFAHAKGVIHRDLKPDNVMLGDYGEVVVMDWGLAAAVSATAKGDRLSEVGGAGGTPCYMAPEMARAKVDTIGFASDIYLLGAILYHIVTGKPPHTGANVYATLTAAANNDITPADTGGDLVEIALKAMASRPADRYPSVKDFQAAIREHLKHTESIVLSQRADGHLAEAGRTQDYAQYRRALAVFEESQALWVGNPAAGEGIRRARLAYAECAFGRDDLDLAASLLLPDLPEHDDLRQRVVKARAQRRARRRRLRALTIASAALAAAIFVTVTIAFFWIRAEQRKTEQALVAEHEARMQAQTAQRQAVAARDAEKNARVKAETAERNAVVARDNERAARDRALEQMYMAYIPLAARRIEEGKVAAADELLEACPPQYRNWEWGYLRHIRHQELAILRGHRSSSLEGVAYTPDGRFLASTGHGEIILWDTATWKEVRRFAAGESVTSPCAFSPDGARIAWAGESSLKAADVGTGDILVNTPLAEDRTRRHIAFFPDGKTLAATTIKEVTFYDAASGKLLWSISAQGSRDFRVPVHVTADWKRVLISRHYTIETWDIATRSQVGPSYPNAGYCLSISPDGRSMVAGGASTGMRLYDVASGTLIGKWEPRPISIVSAAFSPDGKRLVTAGSDRLVKVWDVAKRQEMMRLAGHTHYVRDAAFSPDGSTIASCGADGTVRVWDAQKTRESRDLLHRGGWAALAYNPDGSVLASGGSDGVIHLWDPRTGAEFGALPGHEKTVVSLAFGQQGTRLASASGDGTARVWDLAEKRQIRAVTGAFGDAYPEVSVPKPMVGLSPDGNRLAVAAYWSLEVWNVGTGEKVISQKLTAHCIAFDANRDWTVLALGARRNILLLDAHTGRELRKLGPHAQDIDALSFDPAGDLLAAGDRTGRLWLWRVETGEQLYSVEAHQGRFCALAFSPDGKRLASSSQDDTIKVWAAGTGRELLAFDQLLWLRWFGLAFSPDGRSLAACAATGCGRIWDADPWDGVMPDE